MEERRVARHLRVHGHVQGVFFRATTRQRAQQAGVAGWVRNDPDGTVEMLLEQKDVTIVDAGNLVHAVGKEKAAIIDGDSSLGVRQVFAIQGYEHGKRSGVGGTRGG
jgi:acylphosphatase